VLTDIAGEEDHYGDMDFKVAGTRNGITALQMDIKVDGLAPELMAGALEQARAGRIHILDEMLKALAQPRTEISPYAPRILTIRVPVDKIRDIIGPGGKMIRSIVERTGCKIDIEDDGRVAIASVDESAARKAIAIIEELTATPELNKSYLGKVVRVVEFGAFVEILPGTDGLLHVSEMAHHRVNNVHDEVKEGDQVLVKVVSIDPSGKIRLSRKALLEEAQGGTPAAVGSGSGEGHSGSQSRGGHSHGGGHDRGHGGGHGRDRDRRGGGGGRGGHGRGGGGGGGRDRRD
jgi:polyribonucleotide nucleotidyltransferase